jgi:hypothetical protein
LVNLLTPTLFRLIMALLRISYTIAYLIMACILFEDAMPYFADADSLEICEAKSEKGAEEGKEKSGAEKDFFKIREKGARFLFIAPTVIIERCLIASDSEKIPDSAHRVIFSPPPERV